MAAVRYVSLNPVRARLVPRAEDWPWSCVRAHLAGADDELVTVRPVLEREPCFARLLADERNEGFDALRRAEGTGRPVGAAGRGGGVRHASRAGVGQAHRAPGAGAETEGCRSGADGSVVTGILSVQSARYPETVDATPLWCRSCA